MPVIQIGGLNGSSWRDPDFKKMKTAVTDAAGRLRIKLRDWQYKEGTIRFYVVDEKSAELMVREIGKTGLPVSVIDPMDEFTKK